MTKPDHSGDPAKAHTADSPGLSGLLKKAKAVTDQWAKNAESSAKYQEEFDAKQQEMQDNANRNRG